MSISRRSFVLSAGTTLAALAGAPRLVLPWRRRYALVIRGGTVFDGLGGPWGGGGGPVARGGGGAVGGGVQGGRGSGRVGPRMGPGPRIIDRPFRAAGVPLRRYS